VVPAPTCPAGVWTTLPGSINWLPFRFLGVTGPPGTPITIMWRAYYSTPPFYATGTVTATPAATPGATTGVATVAIGPFNPGLLIVVAVNPDLTCTITLS